MIRPSPDSGTLYPNRYPVDMRKAVNGLVAIVSGETDLDPFNTWLFVSCNRKRTLVKIVDLEGDGFPALASERWPMTAPIRSCDDTALPGS